MFDKKLVMCGCHEAGWYLVEDLLREGFVFDYFVCLSPQQAEQYQVSGYKDFTALANAYQIPVYHPASYALTAEADIRFFQDHAFDLLIQGGWQRLFPEEVLKSLKIGALGGHGSSDYLPKGRGRSPLNWSLIEGKKRFILQLFLMQPGIDDGPILDSEDFDITEFDTIQTLYYKIKILSKRMHLRTIPKLLEGSLTPLAQTGEPSYYPKRTPVDGLIHWETMDVWTIYNFVRAQTRPYPGAYAPLQGQFYKIWDCQVFDTRITYPHAQYGEVVEVFDQDWVVNARGGLLLIRDYEVMPSEGVPG